MRRIFLLIPLIFALLLPVSAYSGVSSAKSDTVVSSDGSCTVTMTVQLHLDTVGPGLVFPLPEKATDITLNGTKAGAAHSGSVRNVDLSDIITVPGDYSLTFAYRLADAVRADEDENLTLELELLSGFSYPIDSLQLQIRLPGPPEHRPSFTSTYYQDSIETVMEVSTEKNVITASIHQRLQDHETLRMQLAVTEEMFPQSVAKKWSMDTLDLLMIGIGIAAVLYWLAFMRCLPPKRLRRTAPPDGITAGEVGCRLTGQGVDFTLMVLSWAQMGYVLIQPDDNGRVLLHKRMDMGNERDDFEVKWFRKLFHKRSIVDGTGYYYAMLCRKAVAHRPGLHSQFLRGSGNPTLLRFIGAAVGAVSGVSLAAAFASDSGWEIVLAIFLGSCGFGAAWLMQAAAKALHSRYKYHLWLALAPALGWYLLSQAAGEGNVALCLIPFQLLVGLGAFCGGKRSETGKMDAGELLGLAHYPKNMPPEELKRNLRINPHYYYDLAPYALALGVDRAFARQMKKLRLPQCPYLTTGMDGHLTAPEWNQLLRDTMDALDATQKRLPIDRLLGR